ncbi:MAG: hypothetical protein C0478_11515 [Planctomyces sp.]|nr:hypothetical protein [Planctomyces sp.]
MASMTTCCGGLRMRAAGGSETTEVWSIAAGGRMKCDLNLLEPGTHGMAELLIRSGSSTGQRLSLPPRELVVGRDESADIRLNSALVSRRHCRVSPGVVLRPGVETLVVEDLGSQNGTFVNEVAITAATTLEPGDRLRVGAMIFELAGAGSTPTRSSAGINSPSSTGFARPAGGKAPSDADITDWLTQPLGRSADGAAEDDDRSTQDTAEIGVEVLAAVRKSLEGEAADRRRRDTSEVSSVTTAPARQPAPSPAKQDGPPMEERTLPPNEWTQEAAEIIREYWEKQLSRS